MPGQEPNKLVVFSSSTGDVEFSINGDRETLWGTRQQIAAAFGCTEDNVRKHIANIYEEKELLESATSERISEVQKEGARNVTRNVEYYNLDVVLAVGYRVSTQKATKFRQWATKTLKDLVIMYLTKWTPKSYF